MKPLLAIITLAVATTALCAKPAYNEKKVVRYAESIDVAKLDRALPTRPLDEWLRSGPARIDVVRWEISRDCDLKSPAGESPKDDWPLCVRFGFQRGTVGGWGLITVGTLGKGVSGPPHLEYVVVGPSDPHQAGQSSTALSDLPRLLDAVSSAKKRP